MEFHQAGAERLPYAQASFDVAVATQVLEYVKDVPGALAEIARVCSPAAGCWSGHRLGLHRLALQRRGAHGSGAGRLEQHLVDPHLPRRLRGWLERASFQVAPPQEGGALGLATVIGILTAPWSASSGMKALITGVNVAYDETEGRKFVKLRGLSILLDLGAMVLLGSPWP
jgi:hypothetical protein